MPSSTWGWCTVSWDKLAWFRRRHGDGCRFRCREPALLLRSFAVHHPAHVFGDQIGVPLEHFFSCVHLIARHRGPLTPESAHQPCAALVHIKLVHRHEGECTRVRPSRLGNMTGQVTVAAEQFNRLVEVVAVGNPFNGAFGGSCSSTPRSCESQSCVLSETRGGGGGVSLSKCRFCQDPCALAMLGECGARTASFRRGIASATEDQSTESSASRGVRQRWGTWRAL